MELLDVVSGTFEQQAYRSIVDYVTSFRILKYGKVRIVNLRLQNIRFISDSHNRSESQVATLTAESTRLIYDNRRDLPSNTGS